MGAASSAAGYPPLRELDDRQRRELQEALLRAGSFEAFRRPTPGWPASLTRRTLGTMARKCFCGCGRGLGFKNRSLSRRAAKIQEAAEFLEEHSSRFGYAGRQQADVEGLIKDGRELRNQLVAVLHGERDARAVDRHRIAHWRGQAKALINAYNMATYAPISGGGGG